MNTRRSWKEYRTIDLSIMALMLAIFEFLIVSASNFWFPDQLYTVSLSAAVTAIVYMRWGAWGGIHAAEAAAVYCYFSGGTPYGLMKINCKYKPIFLMSMMTTQLWQQTL